MKVIYVDENSNCKTINNLCYGDVFDLNDRLYMKISIPNANNEFAVDLSTGYVKVMNTTESIHPIDLALRVKKDWK